MRRGNNDPLISLILFGAIAAAAVIGLIVANVLRRRRTDALQRVAEGLGLEFVRRGSGQLAAELGLFTLFSRGRSKKVLNWMHGSGEGREVDLFDYAFVTGHGKSKRTCRSTVVCLRFDGGGLPGFWLRPAGAWDKMKSWFGRAAIIFDMHPQFSRSFVLRGESEPAIRKIFTPAVLEFYEQHPGLSTEALDRTLLFYRTGKRTRPADIGQFLAETFEAQSLFRAGDRVNPG